MQIASHHNMSLLLIHKFFFLLPVKSYKHILQNPGAATEHIMEPFKCEHVDLNVANLVTAISNQSFSPALTSIPTLFSADM